jgi:MoaA/NifB/PqqE/SkfB family radical SAM enzyme
MSLLVLTLTRACNLRCSYCPTAKDGWPQLTAEDARLAVRLFDERWGGGDVKLFGGEPLLAADAARAAVDEAARRPAVRRVQLSTNGLLLDDGWLELLLREPKLLLQLSVDGTPEDHRRFRRALPGVPDAYARVLDLLPRLRGMPRVVVTQTIPPATAGRTATNFEHLLSLGFRRLNLLPGYYLPWSDTQLSELQGQFDVVAARIRRAWKEGERVYLRNLTTRAPLPFFNSGLVVDADRSVHPANVGLSQALEELLPRTKVGTLDAPPTLAAIAERAAELPAMLRAALPRRVWESTQAVDAALTRLCRGLLPDWAAFRRRDRAAAAEAAA